MMNKKIVAIIDGRNLLYRSHFSHTGLQYKGKPTSAVYGFISILKSILFKIQPVKLIVVWDGYKSKRRLELVPGYKQRPKLRLGFDYEDFQRQEGLVKKMVSYLGIPQVYHKELEADDLIYKLTDNYRKKKVVYIVSSDKDFEQLLDEKVRIWNDKENRLITHKNLTKYKGYKPHQLVDYLCLVGDKSDHIPGYRGVGEKTAIQFLKTHLSIADFLENPKATFKPLDKEKLAELYATNLEMIDLRVHWENNLTHIKVKKATTEPNFSIPKFKKYCEAQGFKSFIKTSFLLPFKKLNWKANIKPTLEK